MSGEKSGKGCLVCMNVLLLVLALLAGAGSLYVSNSKEIPMAVAALKGYATLVLSVSIFVAVFAVIGLCASCGGCFLYIYAIVMNVISFMCLIVSIIFVVFFVLSKKVRACWCCSCVEP